MGALFYHAEEGKPMTSTKSGRPDCYQTITAKILQPQPTLNHEFADEIHGGGLVGYGWRNLAEKVFTKM
jgi:hypothetical protein